MSGSEEFGMIYNKNNSTLVGFYEKVWSAFGLKAPDRLSEHERVPVKMTTGFFGNVTTFEVHGHQLDPNDFLERDSVFHRIAGALPTPRNRTWAFDISQLDRGVLRGQLVHVGSEHHEKSEEQINLLHRVGTVMHLRFLTVPVVQVELGSCWVELRVPEKVTVTVSSETPLIDSVMDRTANHLIAHYESSADEDDFAKAWDVKEGWVEVTCRPCDGHSL